MTYKECEKYVEFRTNAETERISVLLKGFAHYSIKTTMLGTRGKLEAVNKFLKDLHKQEIEIPEENDIEEQFKVQGL